jgi:hypothetical protein
LTEIPVIVPNRSDDPSRSIDKPPAITNGTREHLPMSSLREPLI